MKKDYLFTFYGKAPTGIKHLYACLDADKLNSYRENIIRDGHEATEIKKSNYYYCTDGNKDLHTRRIW